MAEVIAAKKVTYPETDGKPMAETQWHMQTIINLLVGLQRFFRNRQDVYVWGNLFVYYEKDNPKKCVVPDVFAVFGVPKHRRRFYLKATL